jgi:hypothetical protein
MHQRRRSGDDSRGAAPGDRLLARRELTPVALGFMQGYVLALMTFAVAIAKRLNPLWLMAAGALAGIAGL